ncbi:MAG: dihydroxyacetone kinase subunit L [Roseitalea sp.]|jgi:dihydroxyacetone kinase|nr:dihydroxyacetone kinase subunit L [Roseitalea sp.]MBO6720474.1 dihydroxyacetone kinase subunit L [Roseitalea sp.]MBO6743621.1 dihydroxyacetone kinase subunit L [Roseitalea sp.]
MAVTPQTIKAALDHIAGDTAYIENRLNEADARLGDGDTGTMLARMIGVMTQVDVDPAETVGAYLGRLAKASARSTGSSFGTLIIAALMAVSRATANADRIEASETASMFSIARKEMTSRGKTELGAKTVIDSLARIEAATDGVVSTQEAITRIGQAADAALDAFRDKPCRVGRARIFGDVSIGNDDPGMLAVKLIIGTMFDDDAATDRAVTSNMPR